MMKLLFRSSKYQPAPPESSHLFAIAGRHLGLQAMLQVHIEEPTQKGALQLNRGFVEGFSGSHFG